MYFNNGFEKKKFEQAWVELRASYRAAGMSEDDIDEVYRLDLQQFNLSRRETEHAVDPCVMFVYNEDTGDVRYMDMDELPADAFHTGIDAHAAGLEQIENLQLYESIIRLPEDYVAIFGFLIDGYTQSEIAVRLGVRQSTISKKLLKIRMLLSQFKTKK